MSCFLIQFAGKMNLFPGFDRVEGDATRFTIQRKYYHLTRIASEILEFAAFKECHKNVLWFNIEDSDHSVLWWWRFKPDTLHVTVNTF